jgi:fructose-1,6-bisphosphatase I
MNEIALRLAQHVRASTSGVGEVAGVLDQLAVAGKLIARELSQAALVGRLGETGTVNVQGESVKKLDAWANDVVVRALEASGLVSIVVSEEMDEPLYLREAPYVVCVDPVDGSSNLDINGVVGTIFSVRRRRGAGRATVAADAAQPGSAQVAAGYIMYGASTVLVYTTGQGVHGFTLAPTIGEFIHSHPDLRIPARGRIYSVNDGNALSWQPGIGRYIEYLRARDQATGRPYTARYVGSMVADIHRTLLDGGIFLYPAAIGVDGRATGKLRLQYEAAPMGLLVEQAGGRASTGHERILDVKPASPHQRIPIMIGSREDVALAEEFVAGRR